MCRLPRITLEFHSRAMSTGLEDLFVRTRAEKRAALIAYIPAGFPSQKKCIDVIKVLADCGVDAVEIGFPYSDPVMDGPTIQAAADMSLRNGTGAAEVFATVNAASATDMATVVMTYWNPIEKYGVKRFARDLAANGGSGVITPDLTIEEAQDWLNESSSADVNSIFVVAPSTNNERLAKVTAQCSGFIYAASLMGVTGARSDISQSAAELVGRIRKVSDLPIAVGLGVSTGEQAREIATFADGVIVGSAFIKILLEGGSDDMAKIEKLARELVAGVRGE